MIYTLSLKKKIKDFHAAGRPSTSVRFPITDEEAAEVLLLECREPDFIKKYGDEYRAEFKGTSYKLELQSTGERLRSGTEIKVPFGMLSLMAFGAYETGKESQRDLIEKLIGKTFKKDTPGGLVDVEIKTAANVENMAAVILNGHYVMGYSEATQIAEARQ